FLEAGHGYEVGFASATTTDATIEGQLDNINIRGSLNIRKLNDDGPAGAEFVSKGLPFSGGSPGSNNTTFVAMMISGVTDSNMGDLDLKVRGPAGNDDDDIGLIIWNGNGYGNVGPVLDIRNLNTGVVAYGHSSWEFYGPNIINNDYGWILGADPRTGGHPVAMQSPACKGTSCTERTATETKEMRVIGGHTETNDHGNVVIGEVIGTTFQQHHIETGTTLKGHSVLIGAGVDSTDDSYCADATVDPNEATAGDDSGLAGTCDQIHAGAWQGVQGLVFLGQSISGDKGDTLWDGLAVGPGANDQAGDDRQKPMVSFHNHVFAQDNGALINALNSAATVRMFFSGELQGVTSILDDTGQNWQLMTMNPVMNETVIADPRTNGTTTAGIQEAIDSCGRGQTSDTVSCTVILPRGHHTITSGIRVGGLDSSLVQTGIILKGHGAGTITSGGGWELGGTVLHWNGTSDENMLTIAGCGQCKFQDFALNLDKDQDNVNTATRGIYLRGEDGTPTHTGLFENIRVIGSITQDDNRQIGVHVRGNGVTTSSKTQTGRDIDVTVTGNHATYTDTGGNYAQMITGNCVSITGQTDTNNNGTFEILKSSTDSFIVWNPNAGAETGSGANDTVTECVAESDTDISDAVISVPSTNVMRIASTATDLSVYKVGQYPAFCQGGSDTCNAGNVGEFEVLSAAANQLDLWNPDAVAEDLSSCVGAACPDLAESTSIDDQIDEIMFTKMELIRLEEGMIMESGQGLVNSIYNSSFRSIRDTAVRTRRGSFSPIHGGNFMSWASAAENPRALVAIENGTIHHTIRDNDFEPNVSGNDLLILENATGTNSDTVLFDSNRIVVESGETIHLHMEWTGVLTISNNTWRCGAGSCTHTFDSVAGSKVYAFQNQYKNSLTPDWSGMDADSFFCLGLGPSGPFNDTDCDEV
ncbi:MAG: hypothetical protein R3330_04370, partial [Saprospiraceae bacterium]|nr:hypothetical protein [Saprospiraceae bacterium]